MSKFDEKIAELTQCINSLFYDKIKSIKQPYPFHTKRKKSDCDLVMAASLISILKIACQLIDLKNQYHNELELLHQNKDENKIAYRSANKEDKKITEGIKTKNKVCGPARLQLIENYRNEAKRLFYSFRAQEMNNVENIMEYLKNKNLHREKALEGIIFKENLTTLESLARKKRALNKINNDHPRIDNWDIQVLNRFMEEVRKRKVGIIKPLRIKTGRPRSEEIATKAELLYRENKLAVAEIAEKLNITKNTLYSYLRYKNVPINRTSTVLSKSKKIAAKAEVLYRRNKLTGVEIAKKLGITPLTMYHYLQDRNVPINRARSVLSQSKKIAAKAETLYRKNKLTGAEIAKKLGITPITLYRYLHDRNVPMNRARSVFSKSKKIAAKAETLYRKNKLTVLEIAKKLGITQRTLYQYLRYKNVSINRASSVSSQSKTIAAKAEILYRENKLTVTEIAKKLGIASPTLYQYLHDRNVPINRASTVLSKSKRIAAKAETLYRKNKLTEAEIAKKLGITSPTLYQYLHDRNVPINRASTMLSQSKTIAAKAERLYRENKLAVLDIAKVLGIGTGTLYRYLRHRKVSLGRSSRIYK
jgi:predicted transcriptional regulator